MDMQRISEIVYVQDIGFLVSQSKEACRYETRDEEPLVPGFYFALWPVRARSIQYDRSVRYFGPFTTREAAQVVKIGSLSFALIGPGSGSVHPVKGKKPEQSNFTHPALHCA